MPDWAHIGYPIIECFGNGDFVVTKPDGTGGSSRRRSWPNRSLRDRRSAGYALPDVVCDFTTTTVEQVGPHRVKVSGVKGYAPSGKYKVSVTFADGWRIAPMPVVGRDAGRKARNASPKRC